MSDSESILTELAEMDREAILREAQLEDAYFRQDWSGIDGMLTEWTEEEKARYEDAINGINGPDGAASTTGASRGNAATHLEETGSEPETSGPLPESGDERSDGEARGPAEN